MSEKMDRQGVRTPADIERKYNLGQITSAQGSSAKVGTLVQQLQQNMNTRFDELSALVIREEQEKTIDITENGTTEVVPDDGKVLSKVTVNVDVAGGGTENMDKFWDTYQDNGNRTDYATAFGGIGWNNETFKPKYDIKPTNAYSLFSQSKIQGDLVDILAEQGVVLDTSKATNTQYLFADSLFTHIGIIDVTSSTNSTQTDGLCRRCSNLTRIDKLVINEETKFATNTFNSCYALEYIGFEGVISNSLYLQYSPSLNADCVQGIIGHLATVTTPKTLTLNKSAFENDFDRLTATQRDVITNQKGWTLAFA